MTCSCNSSLIHSWTDHTDGAVNIGFTLRDQQYLMHGTEMRVKGRCRTCGTFHSIAQPEQVLAAVLVIPVVRIESVVRSVRVRR